MKNWKTTGIGVITAILNGIATGAFDGNVWSGLASVGIAVMGVIAKDHDVTGV